MKAPVTLSENQTKVAISAVRFAIAHIAGTMNDRAESNYNRVMAAKTETRFQELHVTLTGRRFMP